MKVLVAEQLKKPWTDLPADVTVTCCGPTVAEIDAAIDPSYEVLVSDDLPTDMQRCPGLRWVQLLSAGFGQMVGHPLARRDILVTTAAGMCAAYCAEFVVARILYHQRQFRTFEALQRSHAWGDRDALARPTMRHLRVLLVGYGAIGRETARLLSAFGTHIIVANSTGQVQPYEGYMPYSGMGDPAGTLPARVVSSKQLPDIIGDADVIAIAVPLHASTRKLIDEAVLRHAKPTAILINIARGAVIDTPALVRALDENRLAHAYLDVFDEEPLPATSPLWEHPKISITSHMAGVLDDPEPLFHDLFTSNLARYRAGKPLMNQVDLTRL